MARKEKVIKDADNKLLLEDIEAFAKTIFGGSRASHDWEHTLRVLKLCERIGTKEGVDMDVVRVAAYLHDIGRGHQDATYGTICHAKKGAEMATPIVRDIHLTKQQKANIIHCIRSHRFRGNHPPETPEAKVLFDADKLDAIGAVGIARAYLFAGEVGARLHNCDIDVEKTKPYSKNDTGYREYRVKLRKIRDRILTKEGRRLAEERHEFMEQFFKRFVKEYKGEG
ncbi:MAG: HD domain-containing protein [Desulfobacterales bacterium]|nr:MAG: HD domain-containing protein [Desulfobacterales bacterium]UCD90077.1 MAG: HD domain-containing protein [Desulfobacterales bacterium]